MSLIAIPERQKHLVLQGNIMPLPAFFPSISSIKTNLSVLDYLKALMLFEHPLFLISAYDIYHSPEQKEIMSLLHKAKEVGITVLLDSGNYESYWMRSDQWSFDHFQQILKVSTPTCVFHFDNQMPVQNIEWIIEDIESRVLSTQSDASIIPIIHASSENLPAVAKGVVSKLYPLSIAIPERILGEGVIARAKKLREIRNALNELGVYTPIHLLGTGNPFSILLYVLAGADTFDGLEWCQTVVSYTDGLLYHFQQYDLFKHQADFGLIDIPFTYKVLGHNLNFYTQWMLGLQSVKNEDELITIGVSTFGEKFDSLPLEEILN